MRVFLADCLWRGSFYDRGLRCSRAKTDLFCSDDISFEVKEVIHWMPKILFTAEIAFGSQNRRVPQQELNLLKFSAIGVAQLRAGPTQIMRRYVLQSCPL